MKKNKALRILLMIVICLLGGYNLANAFPEYYFRHYSVEKGLSNNCTTSILQDKTGFLWIGTKDGLNRFDGYSFKVFRKTPGATGSIGSNYVHALYEDRQGVLWVGTENGLYQYHKETETFRLIPATANQYITQIQEAPNGLWLVSNANLYRFTKATRRVEFLDTHERYRFTKICVDKQGVLWGGTQDGLLLKYQAQQKSFTFYDLFDPADPDKNKWIESIYCTDDGQVVVGTTNAEIKWFDPNNANYRDIPLSSRLQDNLYIRCALQANEDEFWFGAESGIYIHNKKTGQTHHLQKDYDDRFALSDNAIYTLCKDREGGIWVGTYFRGLNYLPARLTPFTKYYPQKASNAITGNIVREIRKDGSGNLWIGTEDAGINKLNLQTGKFTNYQPAKSGLSFPNIHGLLMNGHDLWVGTLLHGLNIMDTRTGKVTKHFSHQNGSGFTHDFIYGIYKLSDGTIITTSPNGAFQYDKGTQKFEWYKALPQWVWYTGIIEDHAGVIWAITFGNGVFYLDPQTGKSGNYKHLESDPNSLSNNRVNSVFEDSKLQLWFTTDEGLCKFNKSKGTFTRYGIKDGFPSDFMFSILEDNHQRLWISTTRGLVCFTPDNGKVQVYTTQDGLLNDQFNYNAAFKDTDGRMYFGSTAGMISFNPDNFRHNNYVVPVALTGFHIIDNAQPADNQALIPQSITYNKDIKLSHRQSTFSINFASLSFTAPGILQYSYQMLGLSENWVNIKTNRQVDFVGLKPGTYQFGVKAIRSDGAESEITHLKVTIQPPWWQNSWAYLVYTIIAIAVIMLLFREVDARYKDKNKRKIEKELLEDKINFFTNVAHEIKTPLTLIKVPLAKVMKKTAGQPDVQNSLNIMNRNTDRLLELSNQLLDFRQTEIGKFKISLKKTDISKLLTDACLGFADLAQEKEIVFQQDIPTEPFFVDVDEDAFTKIIYNLLSNAVKYADQKVTIALIPFEKNHQSFTIEIKNDGFLIPADYKEKIFEAFYRLKETGMESGSGIGLALARSLTQLHGGHLTLPPPTDGMNFFSLTLPISIEQIHE